MSCPNFPRPHDLPASARKRLTYAVAGSLVSLLGAPACAEKPPALPIDIAPDKAYRGQPAQEDLGVAPGAVPDWSKTAAASGVTIRNAPASVRIIPEPRESYRMDVYLAGGLDHPLIPRFEAGEDRLIFDGGFSEEIPLCQRQDAAPEAPAYLIVLRTPRDLSLHLQDAVTAEVDSAQTLSLAVSDCAQVQAGLIEGQADLTLTDNSRVSISRVGGKLRTNATDEAEIRAGRIGGDLEVRLAGSALMGADLVGGNVIQNISESASLSVPD